MKKVLLVDDNVSVTHSIRAAMNKATPFTIREVNDARMAYAVALEFAPDVIVMDINMPHKEGPDVAMELREDRRTRDIPIIFLSSLCTQQDQVLLHERSDRDLIMAKPFQLATFLAVIRQLVASTDHGGTADSGRFGARAC
jgi:DNA-binding response OmpR family regulator